MRLSPGSPPHPDHPTSDRAHVHSAGAELWRSRGLVVGLLGAGVILASDRHLNHRGLTVTILLEDIGAAWIGTPASTRGARPQRRTAPAR